MRVCVCGRVVAFPDAEDLLGLVGCDSSSPFPPNFCERCGAMPHLASYGCLGRLWIALRPPYAALYGRVRNAAGDVREGAEAAGEELVWELQLSY